MKQDLQSSNSPLVSVVLPVYNGEKYLRDSIESILDQSYSNLELVAINDGSGDGSGAIIKSFKDERIRYFEQDNQGVAKTLNRGIMLARGKYIARMDADDVSMPQRLQKQVSFLESHQEYGLLGTWAEIWEESRKTNRCLKHPPTDAELRFELIFDSFFVHSSVMIRKSVLEKAGFYNPDMKGQPEDLELWSRIVKECKVANIPEILHVYREVGGSLCRSGAPHFQDKVISLCAENLAYYSDNRFTERLYKNVAALAHCAFHKLEEKPALADICQLLMIIDSNLNLAPDGDLLWQRLRKMVKNYSLQSHGLIIGHIMYIFHLVSVRYHCTGLTSKLAINDKQ